MVERHPRMTALAYCVLAAGLLLALGPLYLILCAASISSQQWISQGMPTTPGTALLANLHDVAQRIDLWRYLFNSLLVAGLVVAGKLLLSSVTAFAVTYFRPRGRGVILALLFCALLLPLEVRIVPTYAAASDLLDPLRSLLQALGPDGAHAVPSISLINTYAGLSLPLVASATGTFLFVQFYRTIPPELVEAARIDGTGPWRFYLDILLPLSKTNFAALGAIVFISTWKDYMWPLVITSHDQMRTITLAMASFLPVESGQMPQWNLLMAAALVSIVIPAVFVVAAQRWFVKGIVGTEK
ncbi:ABC transporter permease subunit [Herbaspirillum sp. DW155]|uniref:carbohydrate ABC transporter permease n=1 Tax=Herbaspirillum sp. DW155 TaxID=3095609 RepID=UPI0030920D5C|nr:ABC transporter permease subunit [Herbaspirillum sp. DW155]